MVLATLAGSVICDRIGNYYLWSLLDCRGDPLLCNAVIVGRLLFALLVIMELAAIGYVFIAAFGHAGRARRVSPQQLALAFPWRAKRHRSCFHAAIPASRLLCNRFSR
jgi:hypothetical protein